MAKLTEDVLKNFIKERIEIYKNEDEVVSKYNTEQQTTGDYNGRQILELVQNADDAGAENISIKLNPEKNELVFFNDGVSFDFEGIKSIMIANLSSKIMSSYIGNKGLGFRSILNWANSIAIYSAGLKIEFSREVLKEYLVNELSCLNLEDIRDRRNLSSECIPLPVLGLPRVSKDEYEGCNENKGCALQIIYNKDKEADIINQIKAIDGRTLLFLQHIEKVEIAGFSDDTTNKKISVDKNEWEIHTKDGELEDKYQDKNKKEKRKYIVKIAIPQSGLLEENSPLYNYLPSKEQVYLPFLLHATVELNSSRNHVNESDVNDYILQKAAELIRDVAQEQLNKTQDSSDWVAYRLMTPTIPAKDYGSLKSLYEKLDELKKDMAIYPTIDNQYATANNYFYYNNDISGFWKDFEAKEENISKVLQPIEESFSFPPRPFSDVVDVITDVSEQLKGDIEKRVRLIRHLYDNRYTYNISSLGQTKIPLFIDNSNNIIEGEAYVQDSGDETLTQNLPSWVEFSVVHNELVKCLIGEFQTEIETAKQQKKQEGAQSVSEVRCLVSLLDFINIRYFDKTGIANKVINQANDKLKEEETDKQKLIVEMLNFLCNIGSDSELKYVRLLNEEGKVMRADGLMLPTELNKQTFEGIDVQYVLDLDSWKGKGALTELNEEQFEGFMKRLGVNRMLGEKKFKEVFYPSGYHDYLNSRKLFSDAIGCSKWDLFKGSENVDIPVIQDSVIEKLKQVNLQNVLRFVSLEGEILRGLEEFKEYKFYYNGHLRKINTPYNYVQFQLSSLDSVKWKVFGADLILDSVVDIDDLGPNAKRVVELIRTDFRYEPPQSICGFLNNCPTYFPNGKNVRKLYKMVIDGLDDSNNHIGDVLLYAIDVDGNKGYHSSKEVFYSDNTCLPKKVIKEKGWFRLDYPLRRGTERITRIFGLRSLNDLSFEIKESKESDLSKDFDSFFRELKPYFLLYAIQNTSKKSSQETIAENIKNCSIHIVSQCAYSINGNENKELEKGEFVNVGNEYYLNVGDLFSIEEMKNSTVYCNAIAEILGMVFKLETKNEHFIYVFQAFDFMKKNIDETRKDEIVECLKLLGISSVEKVFWEKYGELKGLSLNFDASDFYSKLPGFNENDVKKVDFSQWHNKESIDFLKKVLDNMESTEQKDELLSLIDLSAWHKNRFNSIKEEYRARFVHKLWCVLNEEKNKNNQKLFFPFKDDYSNLGLEEIWKHELKEDEDYLKCLNQKVTDLFKRTGFSVEDIALENELPEEPSNLYSDLIQSIQDEKDMEDDRWMLYFEGHRETIEELKKNLAKNYYSNTTIETAEVVDVEIDGEFVESDIIIEAQNPYISTGSYSQKNSKTHKTITDRKRIKLGGDAEMKVDRYLHQLAQENERYKYGEWVSKRDDSAGYDFTYLVDGQLRLLEVKASNNNSFIISNNEYSVAEKKKDVYDIAIVNGDKVTIYKSFFKGNPHKEPKDYYVYFDLK